jgi:hypothetical protein
MEVIMTFEEYIQKARRARLRGNPRVMNPRQLQLGKLTTVRLSWCGTDNDLLLAGEFDQEYQDEEIGPVVVKASGPNGEHNADSARGRRFFLEDVTQ